jgi:hypothetical protein
MAENVPNVTVDLVDLAHLANLVSLANHALLVRFLRSTLKFLNLKFQKLNANLVNLADHANLYAAVPARQTQNTLLHPSPKILTEAILLV